MADINATVAAVAGATALVLECNALAGTDGCVGDAVTPHIVALEEHAVLEAAVRRNLQAIEIVIPVVGLEPERSKPRERAFAGQGVDEIDGVPAEQVMPFA